MQNCHLKDQSAMLYFLSVLRENVTCDTTISKTRPNYLAKCMNLQCVYRECLHCFPWLNVSYFEWELEEFWKHMHWLSMLKKKLIKLPPFYRKLLLPTSYLTQTLQIPARCIIWSSQILHNKAWKLYRSKIYTLLHLHCKTSESFPFL